MSRDDRLGRHVDHRDRVGCRRHGADVGPVGRQTAGGDGERFIDAFDGIDDPTAVGVDHRDAVAAKVGDHQSAAVGSDGDVTDRTVADGDLNSNRGDWAVIDVWDFTGGLPAFGIAHDGTAFAVVVGSAGAQHESAQHSTKPGYTDELI